MTGWPTTGAAAEAVIDVLLEAFVTDTPAWACEAMLASSPE